MSLARVRQVHYPRSGRKGIQVSHP